MGRYGNKLNFGAPKKPLAQNVSPSWPDWVMNVAPEAVHGWFPQQIDSFEKLFKIGEGTYSTVYKPRDIRTSKFIALKNVRFVSMDPESVRCTAREISISRKLSHPNIMKLEGIITSSDSQSLCLLFEYMEHDLVGLATTLGLNL